MNPILVYVTTQNKSEAQLISQKLLSLKLCACTNIIENMESHYIWEKQSQSSNESVLLIKTFDTLFEDICTAVKENHSYTLPAIFAIPIQHVDNNYLEWMKSQV